jgi:hypothetical protein
MRKTYGVLPTILQGLRAAALDLGPASHVRSAALLQILESDFIVSPSMGENSIIRNLGPEELVELECRCVEQAHDCGWAAACHTALPGETKIDGIALGAEGTNKSGRSPSDGPQMRRVVSTLKISEDGEW